MDNWLTIVLGVATGSILAGWIHRLFNGPDSFIRSRSRSRSSGSRAPAPTASPSARVTELGREIDRERAGLPRAIVSWRKSAWRWACVMIMLIGGLGGWNGLLVATTPIEDGSATGLPVGVVLVFILACVLVAYFMWHFGTREIRRIKKRITDLRHAQDHELGLRRGPPSS